MNRWLTSMLTLAVAPAVLAGQLADDKKQDTPMPQDKQAQLLERFGDDGIDANDDGVLTREEVRAFMKESGLAPVRDREGRGHGERGKRDGRRGEGPGPDGGDRGALLMLHRLEVLQSATPPAELDLKRYPGLDADKDGTVSDAEWSAFAEKAAARLTERIIKLFPDADADGDGALSAEELAALKAERMAEVKQRMLDRFPEADTDGDGVISDEELAAFRENHKDRGDRNGDFRGKHRRGGRGKSGDGGTPPKPEVILERHPEADTNGDGELSAEELDAFRAERQANRPRAPKSRRATRN